MHITPTHVSLTREEIREALLQYLNNRGVDTSNASAAGILPRAMTFSLVRDDRVYLQSPLDLRQQSFSNSNQKF